MDHSDSAKTRAAGLAFGFIALVTLALSAWTFYDEGSLKKFGKRTTGTVLENQTRRTRDHLDDEPKWRTYLQVAYLNHQDWFHVPGHVASAYKKGSQIEVLYNENQTKFQAELAPAMGRTPYYILAVSIAATGASIGMLLWAKRMRREEEEPDAPTLADAIRQAKA